MRVTFCGHAEIADYDTIRQWVSDVADDLIAAGADSFYLGGYGAFDSLCASVLRQKKRQAPQLEIVLVLPYLDSNMMTEGYDRTVYPPLETVPKRFAILKRNEWMADSADTVVAYVTHGWGGAAKTLAYAKRRKKKIILYPDRSETDMTSRTV